MNATVHTEGLSISGATIELTEQEFWALSRFAESFSTFHGEHDCNTAQSRFNYFYSPVIEKSPSKGSIAVMSQVNEAFSVLGLGYASMNELSNALRNACDKAMSDDPKEATVS